MRLRYSIRFLLATTAVFGVLALGLRQWMGQTTLEDVAAELNRADAKPYVWDHWNADTFLEDQVEVAHLSGAIPCIGLRFDKITSESTLIAAAKVPQATELVIREIDSSLSVKGLDFAHLIKLHLGGATEKQLTEWLDASKRLEDLSLAWKDEGPQPDYSRLAAIKSLKVFRLSNANVSVGDLSELRKLPRLTHISFYSCEIDDAVFAELASFPALSSLELYGKTCNDHTVRQLRDLRKIVSIDLSSSRVTDRGVEILSEMNHLKKLSLYDCQDITSRCVPALSEMRFLDWLNVLKTAVEKDKTLNQDPPTQLAEWMM
ncbi:Leucine Rich repeats (2 copies) [Stieleria magnilauensis]|uniref:Leucine Rich repeats (2 copies) n=2 Tax=Stieleria magnilauensis TaxID=2527963 RepID=A0ABX5Y8D8_9BACT|nr:Leucine Rich repeats (2 copies) [Planctomycetes bacterium TBK1r]